MSNQGTVLTLGAVGLGGFLLWQALGRGSQVPAIPGVDQLAQVIAQLEAAAVAASGIGSTPPAPQAQSSTGVTTAPPPKPVGQVLVDTVLPFLEGTTNKVNPATGAIVQAAPTERTTDQYGNPLPAGWTYDTATGQYRGPVRF